MKKFIRALLPLTLVAASVSGCSTQLARPISPAHIEPATEVDAAMVIVSEKTCPKKTNGQGLVPGIGSVVAGAAVDFGVNFIGEWLETQQLRRNAVWSASGTVTNCDETYWTKTDTRTVIVQRAVIGTNGEPKFEPAFKLTGDLTFQHFPGPTATPPSTPPTLDKVAPSDAAANLPTITPSVENVAPSGTATSPGEAPPRLNPATQPKTPPAPGTLQITWKSKEFSYGRTAAPARGSKRKHVVVLLGFAPSAMLKTGATATGKEELPGVIRLDLGYVQDGHFYSENLVNRAEAVSTIVVPTNDTLNVTAVVVETEDESLALKALSAGFKSNKDALAGAVKDQWGVSEE
ncbi:hypothetical protein ABI_40000 [Asticcacaulis biprosthecium C19]|uniref:Lipoprotein n=1 Tax=Asticcacaulis biprosthecium C19 TaxID=715226 RepID=F4QS63_9CAUL|nr:hypothetical protein [Asticcacaulis biprosthecium]EGF89583.1 hypothetical protein ABI_40000 [Asticcacaulis biprosthecium C19]